MGTGTDAAERAAHTVSFRLLVAAAGVLVLVGVWAIGVGLGSWTTAPVSPGQDSAVRAAALFPVPPMRRSPPTQIRIPAIGVNAKLTAVDLSQSGEVKVPPLEKPTIAGWYRPGPSPGEVGPAVLVGHVSGKKGPAVFYKVGQLRPGELIEIKRSDRKTAVFKVDGVEKFPKSNFPMSRVFGEYQGPSLRLVTCGGEFVGGSLGYADNIVAFASLVETR